MDNPERVLVLILASALAVFLILAIVAAITVIQILHRVKRIAEKAELVVEKAEAAAGLVKNMAGPMAIGRVLASIGEMVFNRTDGKKSRRDK